MARLSLIVLLLIGGCSIVEYPKSHQLKNFSYFMKQPDGITCGPACDKMVLRYYGIDVNWSELERSVLVSGQYRGDRIGFSTPNGVASGLNKNGCKCYVTRGSISYLKKQISNGKPVIALLRSGSEMWHWVVVIGYDSENFCFADPDSGNKEWISLKNFESSWSFKTDMEGGFVGKVCPWCHGTKKKFFLPCDVCFGYGYIDPFKDGLRSAGIYSYTLVVPNK
jgi:predicted double-glycine peptidase